MNATTRAALRKLISREAITVGVVVILITATVVLGEVYVRTNGPAGGYGPGIIGAVAPILRFVFFEIIGGLFLMVLFLIKFFMDVYLKD